MTEDAEIALSSKAWPFEEAAKLVVRMKNRTTPKASVLFETGYGPSGLPHIGTFGEVARTSMVRHAFARLSDMPTRLVAFSDDMDGLRKVPDNVPNPDMLGRFIDYPLSRVPDPFGCCESFAHHNNDKLREFLDAFGFEYEFMSATQCYESGRFDKTLREMLRHYQDIMAIMLPSLRAERAATYSPFLPISPKTGKVLQVPLIATDPDSGTITFHDEDGKATEVPVTGGHCKLQWKADWAMRWRAFDVDYEMYGKDLIPSAKLSGHICRRLRQPPPEGFAYELFLDANGEKISKSRGNGLTIEQWLTYASPKSLAYFMYQKPTTAKRLHFGVIPRTVDDYIAALESFAAQGPKERYANPVWHIHHGEPPQESVPLSFAVLMNLASVANTEDRAVLWGFISRYVPGIQQEDHPILDHMVDYATAYFRDFVKPYKKFRLPTEIERMAIEALARELEQAGPDADAEALQTVVYEVGKRQPFASLRDWFKALYEILFGQEQGPRLGSFIALYGVAETVALMWRALAGELVTLA
jgi:lysyl-tRNA synthetase class 1